MEGPGHAGPCQAWGQGLGELAFCSESNGKPLKGSKQGVTGLCFAKALAAVWRMNCRGQE